MMNSLFDTYIAPLKDQERHDRQREAVLKVLQEGGRIYRKEMYNTGLPGVGPILNVGGRIHELRKDGYSIGGAKSPRGYYYFMEI